MHPGSGVSVCTWLIFSRLISENFDKHKNLSDAIYTKSPIDLNQLDLGDTRELH